jgi:hypothetical protein
VAVSDTDPPLVALSKYAMGYVDTVHAAAPLPQYIALVYGGVLLLPRDSPPGLDEATAATMVDHEATAFRDWEPDALYAALRGTAKVSILVADDWVGSDQDPADDLEGGW